MRQANSRKMVRIHALVVGQLQTNCYILQSQTEAIIIDPGAEPERIMRLITDTGLTPSRIIATHSHFDHVLGVDKLKRSFEIPFQIHKDDLPILESMQARVRQFMGIDVPPPPRVDGYLQDGDIIKFGTENIRVIHTPGHSPGSISLRGGAYVFTGDALFNHSIGRTDLPGGDLEILVNSIRKRLFTLDDETVVYPGHGPETSIGDERLTNPFVGKTAPRTMRAGL